MRKTKRRRRKSKGRQRGGRKDIRIMRNKKVKEEEVDE